jgi:hypothetical protein
MRKSSVVEVSNQRPEDGLEARIAALEAALASVLERLEKLDPSPRIEDIEPYPIGSEIYSVSDLEGQYPWTVQGYDRRRPGWILVQTPHDGGPRCLPLASVQPLSKCSRADANRVVNEIADPVTREWCRLRRAAEVDAITRPVSQAELQRRRQLEIDRRYNPHI